MNSRTQKQSEFLWCPVCMVHTYHKNEAGQRDCLNEDHPVFLRLRDDPWIEEYRSAKASSRSMGNILTERLTKYPT